MHPWSAGRFTSAGALTSTISIPTCRRDGKRLAPLKEGSQAAQEYEELLLDILGAIGAVNPPRPEALRKVLLGAPALPKPAVLRFLGGLLGSGPDWVTPTLKLCIELGAQRPPARPLALELVLEATASDSADTRKKAGPESTCVDGLCHHGPIGPPMSPCRR